MFLKMSLVTFYNIIINKMCWKDAGVIVPKKHHANAFELTKEEWNDTYELLQNAKEYLDEKFSPDGYTLGWNVGEVSNQFIFHSHFHVIP